MICDNIYNCGSVKHIIGDLGGTERLEGDWFLRESIFYLDIQGYKQYSWHQTIVQVRNKEQLVSKDKEEI